MLGLASGTETLHCSMQVARHPSMLSQLHQVARPLTNLKDILPCLLQRLSFATHGVGEGANNAAGVPRFYKAVHVREALDQVAAASALSLPPPGASC
jgi:hypothetical protein